MFPLPLIRAGVVAVYGYKRDYLGKRNKFGKYLDIRDLEEKKN